MKTKIQINLTDAQTLIGAKDKFDHAIRTYDDGGGPLFVYRDSMGISGIVRAQNWEEAYQICEDEFFPEASETVKEMQQEYGFKTEYLQRFNDKGDFVGWETIKTLTDDFTENDCWQERFGFRPNGANAKDVLRHGIYEKDLNGDSLDLLTPKLAIDLEIVLEIEDE